MQIISLSSQGSLLRTGNTVESTPNTDQGSTHYHRHELGVALPLITTCALPDNEMNITHCLSFCKELFNRKHITTPHYVYLWHISLVDLKTLQPLKVIQIDLYIISKLILPTDMYTLSTSMSE